MTPLPEEIDRILKQAFHSAWEETQPVGKWVARNYDADFPVTLPKAKKALLEAFATALEQVEHEIIGEDKPLQDRPYSSVTEAIRHGWNKRGKEQRKALTTFIAGLRKGA
jgi:hypothetical protein